jgi:hypothetical protein
MMEVALGYLGWSVIDFWDSTPREFSNAFRGWVKVRDMDMQSAWERARMLALYTAAPHSKKKLRPQDIMKFEWDKPVKAKRTPYGSE